VGQATIELTDTDDVEIPQGIYFVIVVAHEVTGIQKRRDLDEIVWSQAAGGFVEPEMGERLLHLVMERGQEWSYSQAAPPIPEGVWSCMVSEARRRSKAIRLQKAQENEALYARRKAVIEAEHAHAERQIQNRLNTAKARGRPESVLALFEAQLQKAEARFEERIAALHADRRVSTRLSDPIAACVVSVKRRMDTRQE
jgi:hypothetical protein